MIFSTHPSPEFNYAYHDLAHKKRRVKGPVREE